MTVKLTPSRQRKFQRQIADAVSFRLPYGSYTGHTPIKKSREPLIKTPPKHNWKVVWWVMEEKRGLKRCVMGKRVALQAWRAYWHLRGRAHVVKGPELWRGGERLM